MSFYTPHRIVSIIFIDKLFHQPESNDQDVRAIALNNRMKKMELLEMELQSSYKSNASACGPTAIRIMQLHTELPTLSHIAANLKYNSVAYACTEMSLFRQGQESLIHHRRNHAILHGHTRRIKDGESTILSVLSV